MLLIWQWLTYWITLFCSRTVDGFAWVVPISVVISIVVCVLSVFYLTRCWDGSITYWPILRKKSLFIVTLVLLLLYMFFSLLSVLSLRMVPFQFFDLAAENATAQKVSNLFVGTFAVVNMVGVIVRPLFFVWLLVLTIIQSLCSENESDVLQTRMEEYERQNNDLKVQVSARDFMVRQYVEQKLKLSLAIRERHLVQKDDTLLNLPGVLTSDEDWDTLLSLYDVSHGEVLTRLKEENPQLTDADMLYIVLSLQKMTPREMSLLLDAADRTVWNRRQVVKGHLEGDVSDLSEWLESIEK